MVGKSACSSGVLKHGIFLQEPDYGSLYEGRNPGFYVEANQMPTLKVSVEKFPAPVYLDLVLN